MEEARKLAERYFDVV